MSSILYPTAPVLAPLRQVYCTDEDVALRALGDYPVICPDSQKLAHGADGVFAAGAAWTLTSPSVDFAGYGVHAGHVVHLTRPRSAYRNEGELLAVAAADAGAITLRRLGKPPGIGQPPAPPSGLTAVEFTVLTFDPQIDVASDDANRWFGIDPNLPDQAPAQLYDPRALQQFCVLHVLRRAYAIQVKAREGDSALKLEQIVAELDELKGRIVVQWGPLGQGNFPTGALGARARR